MAELTDELRAFLSERRYAVLATYGRSRIDLTPIWFLFEDDRLFFATSSGSRKIANLSADPRASVVVDARDPGRERWVAADGTIDVLDGDEAQGVNRRIHERYMTPSGLADERIGAALAASDDVTLRLTPSAWRTWSAPAHTDGAFLPVEP
jgi:PPOX class probable F420-dependent enzyme